MDKLYAPSTIQALCARYDFHTAKSLGQNFLVDKGIIDRIMEGAAIGPQDLVIEIGPGFGTLTREAALRARRVIAVEIDGRLLPILEETLMDCPNVTVLHADILKTDVSAIIREARQADRTMADVRILGNLPYYITTPILTGLLGAGVPARTMTVMVQKEMAARMQAAPGTKAYGAISLVMRYYCRMETLLHVPKEVFWPRPQVDSTVLCLYPHEEKPVALLDEDMFFRCIRAGFAQRRKTLCNALYGAGGDGRSKAEIEDILTTCGIEAERRAETLDMQEFAAIANEMRRRDAANAS